MNSSVTSSPGDGKDSFVISEYLGLLTKSEKDKFKYVCPVCEGHNLSIAKNGKGYTCYDGCTGNQIAFRLRELNGQIPSKKSNNLTQLSQTKNPDKAGKKGTIKTKDKTGNDPIKLSDNVAALNFIRGIWGEKLKFNLRTLSVELNGTQLEADVIHNLLAEDFNVNITKERALEAVYYLSKKNSYDPFKNYLESCRNKPTSVTKNKIALSLFKLDDPYYDELTWLFLLGVVKRTFEPGCKFDHAFVLQGKPEVGKSTFFRVLANGHFKDTMTNKLNVDDLRIMHQHAINEWPELDNFTAKTYEGLIKAFLSRQEDQFRLPYAKDLITYPRRSVIVGTVNEAQFLTDMTGNRRFHIVPVQWIIPPDELELIRDPIWAGVMKDYEENWKGKTRQLELSKDHKVRRDEENESYLQGDILEDAISDWLKGKTIYFTMGELSNHLQQWNKGVLGIKVIDRGTQIRIGKILNRQGWKKKQKWVNGENIKAWVPIDQK